MAKSFQNLRPFFRITLGVFLVVLVFLLALPVVLRALAAQVVVVHNDTDDVVEVYDMFVADDALVHAGAVQQIAPDEAITFRSGGGVAMQCIAVHGVGSVYFDPDVVRDRHGDVVRMQVTRNIFSQEVHEYSIDLSEIIDRYTSQPCPFHEGAPYRTDLVYQGDVQRQMNDVDLDADGEVDRVLLTIVEGKMGERNALLYVNGMREAITGSNPSGLMEVVDIDGAVPGLEIVVQVNGPSSDMTVTFYRYDGERLYAMGTIPGDIDGLEFDGVGSVETTVRGAMFDTWFYRETYDVLEGDFVRREQDFYERLGDREVRMRVMIQLAASPTDTTIVGSLNAGDRAMILGCDNVDWCKARSMGGVEGWFQVSTLDVYQTFDGLSYAD